MKEIRNISSEFKFDDTSSSRCIKGYGILFDHESRNLGGFTEVILPTAISKELLDGSDIKVYLNHNKDKGLLARSKQGQGSLQYDLDEKGVVYMFDAPNTPLGEEVLVGLNRGDYTESSFAFTVGKDRWSKKSDGTYLRTIEKINGIYDFSVVEDGAYSDTYVSIAKRSLEAFKKEQDILNRQITTNTETNNKQSKTMEQFSLLKTINDVVNRRNLDESS